MPPYLTAAGSEHDLLADFENAARNPTGGFQIGDNNGATGNTTFAGPNLRILTAASYSVTTWPGGSKILRGALTSGQTATTASRWINAAYGYEPAETDFDNVPLGGQTFLPRHYDQQDYYYVCGAGLYNSAKYDGGAGNTADPAGGAFATVDGTSKPRFFCKIYEFSHDDNWLDGNINPPGGIPPGTQNLANAGWLSLHGHNAQGIFIGYNRSDLGQQFTNDDSGALTVAANNYTPYWTFVWGGGDVSVTNNTKQWALRQIVANEFMWFVVRRVADDTSGTITVWAISETERAAWSGNLTTAQATAPIIQYTGSTNQYATTNDTSAYSAASTATRFPSNQPSALVNGSYTTKTDTGPYYMRKRPTFMFAGMTYYVSSSAPNADYPVYLTGTRRRTTKAKAFGDLIGATNLAAPVNTVAPSISGTKTQGSTLTGADGTWTGTPSPTVSGRRWLRCDANGAQPVAIAGATATTYVLVANDIGSTIRHEVTETNSVQSGVVAVSAQTTAIAALAAATIPSVGTAVQAKSSGATSLPASVNTSGNVRAVLAVVHDSFPTDVQSITLGGQALALAQASVSLDSSCGTVIYKIVGPVQGAAQTGLVTFNTTRTALVTWVPLLDCDSLTLTNTPTMSAAYGAVRSVTAASTANDLMLLVGTVKHSASNNTPTENGSQTLVIQDETGTYVKGFVAKLTSTGSTQAMGVTFSPTPAGSVIGAVSVKQAANQAPPVVSVQPAVTGTATSGQVLTSDHGTFSNVDGNTVYTYQWYQATLGTSQIVGAITSATSTTYTLTDMDVGFSVCCIVTATTTAGTQSAISNISPVVAAVPSGSAPTFSVGVALSGTTTVGQTLTVNNGTTTNTPTSFAYEWLRSGSTVITGATGNSYTLVDDDVGATVQARVTASNTFGSAVSTSSASATIANVVPTCSANPTISGSLLVGSGLFCEGGTWAHMPVFTYQWQRTDVNGANGANIGGATGSSYTLVTADLGLRVQCVVTASNGAGSTNATSSPTGLVALSTGRNTVTARSLVGTRAVGGTRVIGGAGGGM